jgi:L-arabinose transport system ATP-binding protein
MARRKRRWPRSSSPSCACARRRASRTSSIKVILGRWLSEQGVKVLVIDEPTRGIDVGAKSEIYEILYELAASGMAIVVISSELPEVMGISDRILVMCGGRVSAEIERPDFNEQTILTAALPDEAATGTA